MKKIAVGCAVLLMVLFLFHSSEKVFCATHEERPDYDNQAEDEVPQDEIQPEPDVQPEVDRPESRQRYSDSQPRMQHDAPRGGLFRRISIGMSMRHVTDLIGPPSDTKQYMTGKNFIPFYMGTDTVRLEAIYKGEGRITFTGRPLRVYQIINNPNESGYNE
jgi:uncharacterized Zn finger protein (UPF0148 family)